jgi:ribosome-associated protein
MEEPKSKTQKKREVEALQALGVAMIGLKTSQLSRIPLPEPLKKAIIDAAKIKRHGARARQEQYIGRLMREADIEPIKAAYDKIMAKKGLQNAEFHLAERWRERLLKEGNETLTEFINQYQEVDVQQLRHLIRQTIKESELGKNLGSSKALFRLIRSVVQ